MMFRNTYRIVTDSYLGYEAQVKYWWLPFVWFEINGTNTSISPEKAREKIERHRRRVVEVIK